MTKKTNSLDKLPDPELLVPKREAKKLLLERIGKGNELLAGKIYSQAILDEEREKYFKWSKYNAQLLTKIFSNSKISDEYTSWFGITYNGPSPLAKEIEDHFSDIKDKVNRLESILERLELFAEGQSISKIEKNNPSVNSDNRKVFIIHGHDETRLLELEKILKNNFKLTPIILKDQPSAGATTLIEKFELYAPQCVYAIALFTPDDQVENGGKKYLQARPNVIYELGWFCAKLTRKNVMLVLKEGTGIFSDFQGIIQKRFNNKVVELYFDLHQELKAAGLVLENDHKTI